jgi:hypothetical protein
VNKIGVAVNTNKEFEDISRRLQLDRAHIKSLLESKTSSDDASDLIDDERDSSDDEEFDESDDESDSSRDKSDSSGDSSSKIVEHHCRLRQADDANKAVGPRSCLRPTCQFI